MAYQNAARLGTDNQALEYSVGPPALAYVPAYEYGIGPPTQSRQSTYDLADCRLCVFRASDARLAHPCQTSGPVPADTLTRYDAALLLDPCRSLSHVLTSGHHAVWLDVRQVLTYGKRAYARSASDHPRAPRCVG